MIEFVDITDFFVQAVNNLKNGEFNLSSSLEEIVLKSAGRNLAYVDNRKDALNKYGFDLWRELKDELGEGELNQILKKSKIDVNLKYSQSQQFPDFIKSKSRRANSLAAVCLS